MPHNDHSEPRTKSRIRSARYFSTVGAQRYDRCRDLPKLLPLLAEDLAVTNLPHHQRLVALLRRALRAERMRSRQRHWTCDPARHAALVRATRIENAALRRRCELSGISLGE